MSYFDNDRINMLILFVAIWTIAFIIGVKEKRDKIEAGSKTTT